MSAARSDEPLPRLPRRKADTNKGNFGSVLLVGGSLGMAGSISLSGMAALRTGAGLVRVATSKSAQSIVAGFEPSYMTIALPEDSDGRIAGAARQLMVDTAERATVVACGPGLGQSAELADLIAWLYQQLEKPLIVDADGLNALAERQEALVRPGGPRILTPHPGEYARLTESGIPKPDQRESGARELARRAGAVVILKGHQSVITDGTRLALNTTGNPGMATGGTGDVLTGVVAALVAQQLEPFDAARLAAHVHGLAGDLAAHRLGPVGIIARDLVDELPRALAQCSQ
ncbi:MAG TPA: NAD(P)H-hydrate dehydratase, partial [Pirellulales bacterium]|nr:NAD(P)H-hydrate dehydratase [Pirellulales bacterium]